MRRLAIPGGETWARRRRHHRVGPARPCRRRRQAWLTARPYTLVLAISSFIVSQWFRTGTFIATGDVGPFIRRGWLPELAWSWNHQTTGAGSAGYSVARAPEFILIWLCQSVGLSEYTAQWLFYTCVYGLVGFGVAYLAGAFVRSEPGIVIAGTFGVLNGFFLTRLPNPLNIVSVGSIALLTGIAMRVAQGRKIPPPAAGFALIATSMLAFNPPMLVVAYGWTLVGTPLLAALVLGRPATVRLLRWFLKATPWALALNAYWLVPLAQGYTGGGGATANAAFTDPTNWAWAQTNNLPQNILTMVANWAWERPQYLPFAADLDQPYWVWVRYLLPALVFLAPVVALRERRRLALSVLGLVVVVVALAKGLRPPLAGFNMFLYQYVPGFWLFREPMSKLGQLLVPFFGILLAIYVEGMPHRLRAWSRSRRHNPARPWWPRAAYLGAFTPVLLALLGPYPLLTGSVIPDERPSQPSAHVRVPPQWREIAERVDADERSGRVLVLPLDDYYQMPTTWGFFGVDSIANLLIKHPVLQHKPDGYFGNAAGLSANLQAVETALLSGDLEPIPRLLHALGVAKVIIRHDLVRGLPNRYFADDRLLSAAMARVDGVSRVQTGLLDLWRVGDGSSPTVRAYGRVLRAPMRADAGAAAIGTIDTGTAVTAPDDTTPAPSSPRIDDSVAYTDDVVHWPVPAVDSGSPATTFRLRAAGRYTVAQRARAAAVLTPRVDRSTSRLDLEDRSAVLIDGRVASTRPALSLPLPERPVLAVRAGSRTVSLDGWNGAGKAPIVPTVAVGAATEVTMFAKSARPAVVTPYSPVFDCNDYEPRPARELGLTRELDNATTGTLVRLGARDHSGCTQLSVRDVKPGDTYRIRLEYRHAEGKRPKICVFQVGNDGCELTAALASSREWRPYEQIVTIGRGVRGLQVILYAEVGHRLQPRTVSEYRGLRVDALEPAPTLTVWPPAVPQVSVDLTAGEHRLTVDGGLAGSALSPFEPLADCFRYDEQDPDEAGLMARTDLGPDGDLTYTLGAQEHMACITATAPGFGAASLYELSMQARSVAVRNPSFCVYLRGPDRCRAMPSVSVWEGWTPYEAALVPDPATVEVRIYLYGLRDLTGRQPSQVEYRQVKLRPVASPTTIVLVREAPAGTTAPTAPTAPTVEWRQQNPTSVTVSAATPDGSYLALAEGSAPGWKVQGSATGGAEPVTLQGWMNGWRLTGPVDATLRYEPATYSRYALYLFPVALGAAFVQLLFARLPWSRTRSRSRHRRRPAGTTSRSTP